MKIVGSMFVKAVASLVLFFSVIAIDGTSGAGIRKLQVKTIDGDIIDCVDIYKQPALSHPSMENHTIQMRPTQFPDVGKLWTPSIQQSRGESCPEGMIPILRTQNKETVRMAFANLEANNEHYEWAAAYNDDGPYLGVSGDIYAWNPYVEPNANSINIVACGKRNGAQGPNPLLFQTVIFAGWGVFPEIFKDNKSRIFIAWAKNGESRACINLNCGGFVQVSNTVVLGSYIEHLSVYGDPNHQYVVPVAIFRDRDEPKWWVSFNGERVGYFTSETITTLDCDAVVWGGIAEVTGTYPTPTQIGNGHFSNEGPSKTGAIDHALVSKADGISAELPSGYWVTRPKCYDFKTIGEGNGIKPGYSFLYGGPGSGSNTCV